MKETIPHQQQKEASPAVIHHALPYADENQHKKERTLGLKVVDGLIYPLVNNLGVFVISVGSTFLTSHGHEIGDGFDEIRHNTNNPVIGGLSHAASWVCHGWQMRGDQAVNFLQNHGFNEKSAEMAKTVFFSFADGCALAPAVKLLEDKRSDLAKKIDRLCGTTPEDESVYHNEPRQSWGSVLGGRALTAGIVVPTAVIMDKAGWNDIFYKSGEWLGENYKNGDILGHPVKDFIPFLDTLSDKQLDALFRVSVFEAFYTSVCTAGLYVSSRFLADMGDKQEQKKHAREEHEEMVRTPYTVVTKHGEEGEHAQVWGGKLQSASSHALAT